MPLVTILTPTYNRAELLYKLYNSLCQQNCKDFEWLVIDDGSIDDTKAVVNDFIAHAPFTVRFIRKANGGKHTAVNCGVKYVETELVMIVDSDDWLLPDAVAHIKSAYNQYQQENIGTFTFLRQYPDGTAIVSINKRQIVANYIAFRIRGRRFGDMAEVFKTDILKKYPFPEFEGERFISEDVAWIEMAKKYDSVYFDQKSYVCEYLPDGLTVNDKEMKFSSPLGSMMRGKQLMYKKCGLIANIKGAIIYNCYKTKITCIPDILKLDRRECFLQIITYPLGKLFYKKWMPTQEKRDLV